MIWVYGSRCTLTRIKILSSKRMPTRNQHKLPCSVFLIFDRLELLIPRPDTFPVRLSPTCSNQLNQICKNKHCSARLNSEHVNAEKTLTGLHKCSDSKIKHVNRLTGTLRVFSLQPCVEFQEATTGKSHASMSLLWMTWFSYLVAKTIDYRCNDGGKNCCRVEIVHFNLPCTW